MSIITYKSSSIQVNNIFNSRENKLINKNCLKTTNYWNQKSRKQEKMEIWEGKFLTTN